MDRPVSCEQHLERPSRSDLVSRLSRTFSALRHRDFRYFWIGQCISLMGTWMQRAAQVWLVYTMTGSPFLLGVLSAAQSVPMLAFSLFAGAIVDRFPKRKLIIATQTAMMLQAFILAALTWSGKVQYWHVLVLAVILGIAQTLDMPGRQSFFMEMVGKEDLANAISLNSTIVNLAKIIGPTLAGIAMESLGAAWCFFFNGVSFLAVIWGLLLIRAGNTKPRMKQSNVFADVKEGLVYIWQHEVLRTTLLAMAIFATFAMNTNVIIPVYAADALKMGATAYTTLLSASGLGALAGALYMANRAGRGITQASLLRSAFVCAGFQIAMFAVRNYTLAMFVIGAIGFINLTFNNMANATLQLNSRDELRGRVMSVYALVHNGTTPIGNTFVGAVMERLGGIMGFPACGITAATLLGLVVATRSRSAVNPVPAGTPADADH